MKTITAALPAKSSLAGFTYRNVAFCRTCLHAIRQRPVQVQQPHIAALSTQASRTRLKPRGRRQPQESKLRKQTQSELIGQLPTLPEGTSDDVGNVRFFEQDGEKRVELQDDGSFEQSLSGLDASGLKDSLFELRNSIGSGEAREAFAEVMDKVGGGSWGGIRTADDIESLLPGMDEYTASIDAQIEATLMDLPQGMREHVRGSIADWSPDSMEQGGAVSRRNPIPQIPEKPWSVNQYKKITRLNSTMSKIYREMRKPGGLTEKHIQAIYKAYHAARRSLAASWSSVPINVWDFLWGVLSANPETNTQRFSHIAQLSRDMAEAGATLSHAQQLFTIEALFLDGWEEKAVENWKRCVGTLGKETDETFRDFWELGVRMYCRVGDLAHAESAAQRLLANHSDPRILLPIIQLLSERGSPSDHEKAWTSYRQMRELLGRDMKLKDYDRVISYFLTTNQVENALFAFVDMMSDGRIDMKQLNKMPSVVANKFFLGKWLKRLIGAGDLDGAYSVVEFMRQKGVQAAPIQLNGLIGAWQRSGSADNMQKADDLAWKMIDARIAFVSARDTGKSIAPATRDAVAPLPRATLETFCVLAENYRTRDLQDRMRMLWDASRDAKISADAFMMNQLLESHLQSGQASEAEQLYHTLVVEQGVTPDAYTFSALWKIVGINRFYHADEKMIWSDVQTARKLFAETAKFRGVFQRDGGIDIQLSRKILHTLRRLKDHAGFLVALSTLRRHFKFLPTETLVIEMVLGTRKLSWDTPAQRKRLILTKREIDQELLAWAGGDAAKLEGENRGVALYEYLKKKSWPAHGNEGERAEALVDAAKQMGVYDLLMGEEGDKGNSQAQA